MIWAIRKVLWLTVWLVVVAFGCAYCHQIKAFVMHVLHRS